jgi:hypothetical protein
LGSAANAERLAVRLALRHLLRARRRFAWRWPRRCTTALRLVYYLGLARHSRAGRGSIAHMLEERRVRLDAFHSSCCCGGRSCRSLLLLLLLLRRLLLRRAAGAACRSRPAAFAVVCVVRRAL